MAPNEITFHLRSFAIFTQRTKNSNKYILSVITKCTKVPLPYGRRRQTEREERERERERERREREGMEAGGSDVVRS